MFNVYGYTRLSALVLLLLISILPISARADVYKCKRAGAVAYQETPCEGANVQATQIEVRGSNQFVGCFGVVQNRGSRSIEVRANGAGTYQLVDEQNPLGAGTMLKPATPEELTAFGNGLHMKVSSGLSVYLGQRNSVTIYTSRFGSRYVSRAVPVAQPITAGSLYGLYTGTDSEGLPVTLFFMGGGMPQVIAKTPCAKF